jgi:cytoskeletal protein RodZ
MVQPSESLLSKDSTRSFGTNSALRCPLLKSEMRTVLMVVTNILGEQSLQMAFIQRNNLVQQFSSTASDPTLREAILPGTSE